MDAAGRVLVIACGALAREIHALKRANHWDALDIACLPPELHNHPDRIPDAVAEAIAKGRATHRHLFVAYADCGTGGLLDRLLEQEQVERLPGAHCYEFFATSRVFEVLADAEPGTFYLTDFLVRHFDRLVAGSLGIDRHPELIAEYFRHYSRVLYLVQDAAHGLSDEARSIAARLGLRYEERETGYGDLQGALAGSLAKTRIGVVVEATTA